MENDAIRSSGTNTLVDIWIEGKMRAVCISQQAIGAFVGFDKAADMSDRDRCEFVRAHLSLVLEAAKSRLRETDMAADAVTIDVDDLERPDGGSGNRRQLERRKKTNRRKSNQPRGTLPERRRGDRRQGERRGPAPKPD